LLGVVAAIIIGRGNWVEQDRRTINRDMPRGSFEFYEDTARVRISKGILALGLLGNV